MTDNRMSQLDPQLGNKVILKLWDEITRNESLPLSDLHTYFSDRYGKDKSSKSGGIVERAIAKIIERSGGGIKGLQRSLPHSLIDWFIFVFRSLAIMDDNGDKRLTKSELK